MKLELITDGEICSICQAVLFRFRNPDRYVCLREKEHQKFMPVNPFGRRGRGESGLRAAPAEMPHLRDAAVFVHDDVDLPESA
jgi:hypothetical protein